MKIYKNENFLFALMIIFDNPHKNFWLQSLEKKFKNHFYKFLIKILI